MGDAVKDLFDPNSSEESIDNRALKEKIFETQTEEIIIGLCGPIGTDIHFVAERLELLLKQQFQYNVIKLRLSDFIKQYSGINPPNNPTEYQKIDWLINSGNKIREKHGNDILAQLAINEIAAQREVTKKKNEAEKFESERVCYIVDSIKNNEELELFRLIYGDLFYFIGTFSSIDAREKYLVDKGLKKEQVHKLFDRDSGEEMNYGQKVTDTFVQADFFFRTDKSTSQVIDNKLLRSLNLIFKTAIVSPSSHEKAMYLATAAAGNSACLSRQVGASITDKQGEVLGIGWNDVPKANGGVYEYNEGDPLGDSDYRCLNLRGGICFNDDEKKVIREALVNELIESRIVKEEDKAKLVEVVRKSRIKELIEFSRAVHAEMLAIIQASQKAGDRVIGGRLYCTTYPCHNCARHIVAAGIKEVYYIEPYRKSLAIKLHDDSITEDESKVENVRILIYEGVSPRRYLEFFKVLPNSRKKDGKKNINPKDEAKPQKMISLQAIPILEKKVTETLISKNIINVEGS